MATFPCPKCGRKLKASGKVSVSQPGGDLALPVFQCEECLVQGEIFGEPVEVALTFVVDAQGRAFDPAAPEKPLFASPAAGGGGSGNG